MTVAPFVDDGDVRILLGDCREVLATLEDSSVDCVATSPPFFGLRDYGVDGQIGLEASPEEWAAELVAVFRECRRVLRPAGSMFIECGDSYAQGHGGSSTEGNYTMRKSARGEARHPREHLTCSFCGWVAPSYTALVEHHKTTSGHNAGDGDFAPSYRDRGGVRNVMPGFKPKDLIGQPFLLAFALRADGWYWRGCYPWSKPNAMPESAKDRCTTSHSYVLHFSKKPRYFFDGDAIAEPAAWERWGDQTVPKYEGTATATGWMQPKTKQELTGESRWNERIANGNGPTHKHPRSVWTIPTQGFPGAHFAVFPEALAERIILAGCPLRVCGTCGKERERLTDVSYDATRKPGDWNNNVDGQASGARDRGMYARAGIATRRAETVGWSDCGHGNYQPGVVLDCFGGSGTTAVVARRLGRQAILIELNEEYARMAADRVANWWKAPVRERDPDPAQMSMLERGVSKQP